MRKLQNKTQMHNTTHSVSIYQGGAKNKLIIGRKAWQWNYITEQAKKKKKKKKVSGFSSYFWGMFAIWSSLLFFNNESL